VTRGLGWVAAFALLAAATTGCQERLTAPAECPELCPGGESRMFDTVIGPLANTDTSYVGYVARGSAGALLVSNGLPASEDRAVIRFNSRPDSLDDVNDTLRAYTVDSALLALSLVARDTLVNGLKLYLYRIDPSVDADDTFESVSQQLLPTAIIDSIEVPDSVNSGLVQTVLRGAEVEKVALPTGGGGVLAIGVAMAAEQPSGVRIGSSVAGTGATFISYVTLLDVADTGSAKRQSVTRAPAFNAFVTQSPLVPDNAFLSVGGEPSSRALLRFDLPEDIEDSATIVRATLELVPRSPMLGLPSDPALLQAKALLADLGAKSPVTTDVRFISVDTLAVGSADTVRLDMTSIVRLWQAASERPEAVFLSLLPEGASFTRPVFGSTRSGTVGAPRLRITYLKPFPFENP
jgi:hypothetical protein